MTKAATRAEMTLDERIKRDGDRWRYIWLLEQELGVRKARQSVLRSSLALNAILILLIVMNEAWRR